MEKNNKPSEIYDWSNGLNLFVRLSSWIVFPVLLAVFVGEKLDARYGTEPWLLFSLMVITFIVSMVRIIMVSLSEFKKFDFKKKEEKK